MPLSENNNKNLVEAAKTDDIEKTESLFKLNNESPSQAQIDQAVINAVSNNAIKVARHLLELMTAPLQKRKVV